MTPHRVLNVWVRALTALVRVTRRVRITSTMPDLALGIAVDVLPSTARAICSASSWSDLPSIHVGNNAHVDHSHTPPLVLRHQVSQLHPDTYFPP